MSSPESPESIIIVGAGIVGSALAHFLSSSTIPSPRNITVIDRSQTTLLGSTGHAPGFVGQFNDSPVLTRLAVASVAEYASIPGGFDPVGGLEVAFTSSGVKRLEARRKAAGGMGLAAEMVSLKRAAELAPRLVDVEGREGKALFFESDGTADAQSITKYFQEMSKKAGVCFLEAHVKELVIANGRITGVQTQQGLLTADKVILATGIWAQTLCCSLPIPVIPVIPVGHPYQHASSPHAAPLSFKSPFVRWPESHAYARDHGDRHGLGSYNHAPILVSPAVDGEAISQAWPSDFDDALRGAEALLPEGTRAEFAAGGKAFNGIFSMTPDNMPLVGAAPSVAGLYLAVAAWVTHAAGTAKFLASLIDGRDVDEKTREALEPERFRGQDYAVLEDRSLRGYNEIYKTEESSGNN